VVPQPFLGEHSTVKFLVKPFDDKGQASHNYVQEDKLFEVLEAIFVNSVALDPDNLFKVWRGVHKFRHVQIWR
jgi:hypothetical protein